MYRFDPGTTGITIYFKLRDIGTGLPKPGVKWNDAGALGTYTRQRQLTVSFALTQLSAADAAWQSGGFIESNLQPALYRVDVPDGAGAVGTPFFVAGLNFNSCIAEVVLVRLDKYSSNLGSGATQVNVSVVSNSVPLVGARVWITTDAQGTNIVAGTVLTDTNGVATFFLNTGTYYAWVSDPGYQGTLPMVVTVP